MKLREESPKGVDEVIGKPTTQKDLRKIIAAVMKKTGIW
jgi:hypothetical protein